MGPINARVVRRSLALRGLAQQVSYSECSSVGLWLRLGWVYASRGFGRGVKVHGGAQAACALRSSRRKRRLSSTRPSGSKITKSTPAQIV